MILELAILNVLPGREAEFETAFEKAKKIISVSRGYINHQLQKCVEVEGQYILLVNWGTIEDHTEGFRKSDQYDEWKKLLHHFYKPFPIVQHYLLV